MIKDKKRLGRIIATWLITGIMLFVFFSDIFTVSLSNYYASKIPVANGKVQTVMGDDKIHFLNTANSDCIIIESNGHFALVDSGEGDENPRRKTKYKGYKKEVLDYIKKVASDNHGFVHFDFILATHMHYDHTGNFETIINDSQIKIDRAYIKKFNDKVALPMEAYDWGNKDIYNKIIRALNDNGVPIISQLPENTFDFQDFQIKFINTVTPLSMEGAGENANSVGVIVTKNNKRAFLAADFTNEAGFEGLYANKIGDVDLLKIGHHGYYGSSSKAFLKALNPKIAVCTNYLGKIYPNVKWNLVMIAKVPIFSTEHRNGIIATFTDDNKILITDNIM